MRFPYRTVGIIVAVGIALVLVGVWMSDRQAVKDKMSEKQQVVPIAMGEPSPIQFEIADTMDKQTLGLGNRASIPDNYGMLFVFKDKGRYGFWMKDMLTSIDIIWLSDNGTVTLIDHSVDPSTYPHVFYPPDPVKYVLETRAGYARDHNVEVGTKVPLPSPYGN